VLFLAMVSFVNIREGGDGPLGRRGHRWIDNIKFEVKEILYTL
jgi:hypothetical protein